nr:MAG TPA: hypothetical protein [Caudoviricetes sp.]
MRVSNQIIKPLFEWRKDVYFGKKMVLVKARKVVVKLS